MALLNKYFCGYHLFYNCAAFPYQDYWDSSVSQKNQRDHVEHNNIYKDDKLRVGVEEHDVKRTLNMVASGIVSNQEHKDDVSLYAF